MSATISTMLLHDAYARMGEDPSCRERWTFAQRTDDTPSGV